MYIVLTSGILERFLEILKYLIKITKKVFSPKFVRVILIFSLFLPSNVFELGAIVVLDWSVAGQ